MRLGGLVERSVDLLVLLPVVEVDAAVLVMAAAAGVEESLAPLRILLVEAARGFLLVEPALVGRGFPEDMMVVGDDLHQRR